MTDPFPIEALRPVADALHELGVEFYIGGSIASVFHGLPRSTIDVDLVANFGSEHVHPLITRLSDAYYADAQMMLDAIRQHRSFNLIHLDSMYKIDIFVMKQRPFDQAVRERVVQASLFDSDRSLYNIASAEDTILSKLEWYRAGGEVSERQWLDVIGVMKVQQNNLDRSYLEHWADELHVADLLARASQDSSC